MGVQGQTRRLGAASEQRQEAATTLEGEAVCAVNVTGGVRGY